jgi:hypothetical protein
MPAQRPTLQERIDTLTAECDRTPAGALRDDIQQRLRGLRAMQQSAAELAPYDVMTWGPCCERWTPQDGCTSHRAPVVGSSAWQAMYDA